MRKPDRLDVSIVDGDAIVRRLATDERHEAEPVSFVWDGRDDLGRVVPEGVYHPRIHLDEGRQTIRLPNPIRVDVTPPRPTLVRAQPRRFSPDGDGRSDKIRVVYAFDEAAHALVFANGERVVRSYRQPREGKVDWPGRKNGRGVPAGSYRLTLAGEDLAGNVSRRTRPVHVVVRYVHLARERVRTRAGMRFGIRVEADARRIRWRFGGRTGTARPGLLVLRAPRRPGRYTLFVTVRSRADRASVVVRRRGR
jgi:hypothetical protein